MPAIWAYDKAVSAARGRPVIAPRPGPSAANRIAWLLRTSRLYGPDDRFVTGSVFAQAFRGPRALGVHSAQITRWELGTVPATYSTLRQYEDLLGLPSHGLVAVADMIHREFRGGCGRSFLDRSPAADPVAARRDTHDLLDRALGGDLMPAMAWDRLTSNLWALPDIYLYPKSLWANIAQRLLAEMVVSEGVQWVRRSESLNRLLGHSQGELPVITSCAALVGDSCSPAFVEPLMVLESSAHPEAARQVIAQLQRPTNDDAHDGAWWSAAEKIGHGHFTMAQQQELMREALAVLTGSGHRHRVPALELLYQLPPAMVDRSAIRRLRQAPTPRSQLSRRAKLLVDRICTTAISGMRRDVFRDDPVLRQVFDEMLFHPQLSVRFVASTTLRASAYRYELARAVASELRKRALLDDPDLAAPMVGAISQLGDDNSRPLLEELAMSAGLPSAVNASALRGLAHCAGSSSDAFWSAAMNRHSHIDHSARGVVYGLGVARRQELLAGYRRTAAGSVQTAAARWLNIPRYIADSTSRKTEHPEG